jgi:hypothetical protein
MNWFKRKPDQREAKAIAANIEADLTFKQAAQELRDVRDVHAEALSLAMKLHQIRERNHFGESLEGLYREKK